MSKGINACGLTDSIASIAVDVAPCPSCGASARLVTGTCVSCVLQEALRPPTPDSGESLQDLLAQVDVCDGDWQVGNYNILEEIGRGGMGVIYKARQGGSRRIVALKRILSYHADNTETLVRFRREAEAAASLDHPNILPIYEVGEADDLPFFTMKLAPGGSLQSAKKALRDDPRQCVSLLERVARAVQYAHEQGILHRDLKPGNILLDGWREPMVSDFGLAKWLDASSDLTRTLTIFGTPGYIAPEQAGGPAASLKPAADIYSLGAILFDLLAGRPPFLGEHALAVMRQAADKPAPALRSVVPELDRELETICAKCLEREPAARYSSAGDLAADLQRWLDGQRIVATPVRRPTRLWRWAKKNPLPATVATGLLVMTAAALVGEATRLELRTAMRNEQLSQRSIAVLPTLLIDSVQVDTGEATAIADSLQTALSRIKSTRVVPIAVGPPWLAGAANVQDIKEANRKTNARLVVATTAREVNGRQRVSVRLLNGASGQVLRTHSFEAAVGDSLAEPIRAVVAEASSVLDAADWSSLAASAPDPGMSDAATRDLIISGRQLMLRQTLEDYDRAIGCLERALTMEPRSAIAHAYLATVAAARTQIVPDARFLEKAELAALRALQLNPDSADAHRSLAGVYFQQGQVAKAVEAALRAVEAGGPEERVAGFLGMALDRLGQPKRALGWFAMAQHWAVMRGEYDAAMGLCWAKLGEDELAEKAFRSSMELRPEISDGWSGLCKLRLLQGDFEGARRIVENRLSASSPDHRTALEAQAMTAFVSRNYAEAESLCRQLLQIEGGARGDTYNLLFYTSALGRARQALGDEAGGRELLQQARARELAAAAGSNPEALYSLAAISSCLGEAESALEHLRAAIERGWLDYRFARLDPRFDHIKGRSSFPPTSRESQRTRAETGRRARPHDRFNFEKLSSPAEQRDLTTYEQQRKAKEMGPCR